MKKKIEIGKSEIKSLCMEMGADLVGIAASGQFSGAPQGFHPGDVLRDCQSVVVLGCEFPPQALDMDPIGYTRVRNEMTRIMNELATSITKKMRSFGYPSKAVTSITSGWYGGRARGPISLKHAAELAGLGRIGKNTLLINPSFGNMIWLSAVLTSLELEPDPPIKDEICIPGCRRCIENCPTSALGNELMDQRGCRSHAFKTVKGKLEIRCWKCRHICPRHLGIKTDSLSDH